MNSRAFKFGAWERLVGSVLLLVIWSATMIAVMAIMTQHGDPTEETARAMGMLINAGLVAIGLLFWGRPLFHGIRHAVNRLRRKYRKTRRAA